MCIHGAKSSLKLFRYISIIYQQQKLVYSVNIHLMKIKRHIIPWPKSKKLIITSHPLFLAFPSPPFPSY